ncbi:MAG: thioredoxin family protein [Planctomycetaceae bacterium]|nr:thioredoxin family protein [Planctomycetaceae bacterium]
MSQIFVFSAVGLYAQVDDIDKFFRELDSGAIGSDRMGGVGFGNSSDSSSVVKLSASYSGKYIVVKATIVAGYHTFAVTQPSGGSMPTRFEFASKEIADSLVDIRPTAPPKIKYEEVFKLNEQHHEKSVTWLFTFNKPLPTNNNIKITFDGQACDEACIPLTIPFEAQFDPELDPSGLLEQAATIDKNFIFTVNTKSTTQSKDNINRDGKSSLPEKYDTQETITGSGLTMILFYAFLGGVILNFMPCVLPVIGLKILSFFEQAGKSRSRAFLINLVYSCGLISVFVVLAVLNYGLSKLFTFELFSIVMAVIVFSMALSLMGIWELSVPTILGGKTSAGLMRREGFLGTYFKGIITTLLAIPCGAPLLSTAITWADEYIRSGETLMVFLIYVVIGFGMASPYLLIGAFPELLRFLPKPGDWMETFKKAMGFCLLIAVIWILYFVRLEQLLPTVALMFAVWFACWRIGSLDYVSKLPSRLFAWILSLAIIAMTIIFSYDIPTINNPYTLQSAMHSRISGSDDNIYTPAAFEKAILSGRLVIVDFTADWCVTCKVLESSVLNSEQVKKTIEKKGAILLVADCTREGDATKLLHKLNGQVPVLAFFDPKNPSQPIVLRGLYTRKNVIDIVNKQENK